MDLNADGHLDILSGSYSRHSNPMAGLFQVLWGTSNGEFQAASVLEGTDGEPLIITTENEKQITDVICTRPFAADVDGDGNLDIVTGNFSGTFAYFRGEGNGKFSPTNTWLMRGDEKLSVPAHSDPFLVDWDGDGDLDILSGSSSGGAFLFANTGTTAEPKWAQKTTLVETHGRHGIGADITFGDEHIKGPQSSTRIWADDVDGDGLLDLLLGDMVTLNYPAKGLDVATARTKYADWQKRFEAASSDNRDFQALWKERDKIIDAKMTGQVWLLRQLPAAKPQSSGGEK